MKWFIDFIEARSRLIWFLVLALSCAVGLEPAS